MKTRNIFKTLAMAMLMPAMLLTTACSNEDIALNNTAENTAQKGYAFPVTVSVTRQGDAAGTRASFNESTHKLEFSAGDKLFVKGSHDPAGDFAGTLEYVSDGNFSGTITTENEYTGTVDDLFAEIHYAALLPNGYNSYGFLSIENIGSNAYLNYPAYKKAFAESKAEAVEQFSYEYTDSYSSGFALSPQSAIVNFSISGLTPDKEVAVVFDPQNHNTINGNVTVDGTGTATFAIGLEAYYNINTNTLTVDGNAIALPDKTPEAGHIYNITRAVMATSKELSAVTTSEVGWRIGSDGKAYSATGVLPTGVTAVAKIAYVGGAGSADASSDTYKGLALALEDVSEYKAWCSQTSETCLTNPYSSESAAKGDMAGMANTNALVNHATHYTHHDAANAARDYSVTRPAGTSAWFLPSAGQWDKMATAAGGYANLQTNAGLQSIWYWSSSEGNASTPPTATGTTAIRTSTSEFVPAWRFNPP